MMAAASLTRGRRGSRRPIPLLSRRHRGRRLDRRVHRGRLSPAGLDRVPELRCRPLGASRPARGGPPDDELRAQLERVGGGGAGPGRLPERRRPPKGDRAARPPRTAPSPRSRSTASWRGGGGRPSTGPWSSSRSSGWSSGSTSAGDAAGYERSGPDRAPPSPHCLRELRAGHRLRRRAPGEGDHPALEKRPDFEYLEPRGDAPRPRALSCA